ncbi:MAG: hypothetical protein WDM81_12975 [Rhizomicrobium sp.]
MKINRLAVAFLVLSLSGCATSTPYKPAENSRATGYSDERLADNRFRVTFQGNSSTRRDTVENFLLLRSAEVTRDAGYAWFEFDNRDTEAKTTYHTDFAGYPGWGPGWGAGFGWYRHSWRYDPWDPFWHDTAFPTTRYEAYAEIVLLTPEQAKADPHALQASDVIARLGPQAAPPAAH